MRITIEDLEALKELSDELEENHVETEQHLHGEIGVFILNIANEVRIVTPLITCQRLEIPRFANNNANMIPWKKPA